MMDSERKSYSDESQNVIRKQRCVALPRRRATPRNGALHHFWEPSRVYNRFSHAAAAVVEAPTHCPPWTADRNTMDKLKRDNETLKEELALETKQAMQSNSSAAAAQIAKLQDQADTYTRKIEMEKRRIDELDRQISIMQKNILEQRKKMGGVNAAKDNHAQVRPPPSPHSTTSDRSLLPCR